MTIEKYRTPYKYGRAVLAGSGRAGAFDEKGVDIPFVFMHHGQYYMMYTGFDGIGYQTALAVSDDLLNWRHEAIILKRSLNSGRWDQKSVAGTWIIKESDRLYDIPKLKKIAGKYWLAYHAYPGEGYEEGPAAIGLAWCEDEDLKSWHRLSAPVLTCENGGEWEQGGLYKACIIQKDGLWYMFYNAKNREARWIEQTGAAVSADLLHWERVSPSKAGKKNEPLLKVTPGNWDGRFVSDPYIVFDDSDGGLWLNFYFGYENGHAQEGLAFSSDLLTWEKAPDPVLPYGAKGDIDENHAHKASIFYKDGILYHFYCATRKNRETDSTSLYGEWRTITVAASKPWQNS
ncbi:MAG: hypothetical protein KHX56_12685 [Clostridiales bacterium]|nr:hypothetical protein [Clostridiales bacterium]